MSALSTLPAGVDAPVTHERVLVRSIKVPVVLDVAAVVLLVLGFVFRRSGETGFGLSAASDFVQIGTVVLPTGPTTIVLAILCTLLALASHWYVGFSSRGKVPAWLAIVFAFLFVVGFLTWACEGKTFAVVGLLAGGLGLATPLIFGALGGAIGERVGVVNIAIEGQLLLGAFTGGVVASLTRSPWAGLVAAMVAGMLLAFILAVFSITYFVDQVIIGVVINVLVTGLTNFLYSKLLAGDEATFNSPPQFPKVPIPFLSSIPIVGPMLFDHTLIEYLMYIAVFAVWFGMFRTKWGLRLRAVGEHPTAADTVGINVRRTRFWNVALAGAIVGIGGAFYTLDYLSRFNREMTDGAGYIALAAVIFGRWDPIRATLAALLFGFAQQLNFSLQPLNTPVPTEFMLMLPFLVTIFAVAGFIGHSRAPAASGKPYITS